MLRLLYSALQHAAAQAHRAHAPPGTRAASSTGTHLPKCELILPTLQTLTLQLHNYQTIAAFAGGYWILWLLFRRADARVFWSFTLTLLAAAGLEVAEVMTKRGSCRVQDLVPALAGALGAAVLLGIWSRLRRKPAYVRLQKPRSAAPPRPVPPAPPSPRAGLPPRAVVYDPPAYAPPPPPADFSPAPTTEIRPAAQSVPTEARAPNKVMERLREILGRFAPMLQRVWATIVGRRRAVLVGAVLLLLVGAAAFAFLRLKTAPAVTAQTNVPLAAPQPAEEPPPAPRQIQSEVEGYYEPNYKFTVSDRRFIRVTLRPEASLTFARVGTKENVGCADARIGQTAVYLRCALESAGLLVTIDGRFASRYASDRLDMPVLSALITVTNTRGEVQYRARDSFYWHVPD
jgi:hypothetical protein